MDFTFTKAIMNLIKTTQLNLSPIGVRNQRKFAPNPSPIQIRIPACTPISILGINFGSGVQSI